MRQVALLAALTLALLVPTSAMATPTVYVAPYGLVGAKIPPNLSRQSAGLLREELGNIKALGTVDGPSLDGSSGAGADASKTKKQAKGVARAEKLVGLGDTAMTKLNFDGASSNYRAAVKLFIQNVAGLKDFGRVTYTKLSLATALFRAGKEDEGQRVLGDVVRLDPKRNLDPSLYPPVFVRTFQTVQKKLMRPTRGAISVVSDPAGASVSLDGRVVGATPLLIKDLIRGAHYLSVRGGEGAPWNARVDVTPTKVRKLDVDLGGKVQGPVGALVRLLSGGTLKANLQPALAKVASLVKADYVVFGALGRTENDYPVRSFIFSAAKNKIAALPAASFDLDMLGAAIEVYKLAGKIEAATKAFPEAVTLPKRLFAGQIQVPAVVAVAEVSAAPAAPPAAAQVPRGRTDRNGARQPVQPVRPARPLAGSRSPVGPRRGPIGPSRGPIETARGPVTPQTEARPPRVRQRGSLTEGSRRGDDSTTASSSSGPGHPIGPLRPVGPVQPDRGDAGRETQREEPRSRQVGSLTRRGRLEAGDLDHSQDQTAGPRYSAVDIGDIVIPKDELKQKKGFPGWAWALVGVGVAGLLGGGGYVAYDKGLFTGSASSATATFQW